MTATHTSTGSVGRSPPRVDGPDKVTGRARYVADLTVPGALHGRTLRATVPHGRLVALRLDPVFDWTGVTVVTAADIPGRNLITLIEDDQPALVPVGGTIRHREEALALVAADSPARAAQALAHVQPEVEALPAALDIDAALAADVLLHGTDNVFKRLQILAGSDVDTALAGCDIVIEGQYTTGAQEQMYIEPQGVIARFDQGGACHVIGSMQCPYYVHAALKPLLDLDDDSVIVEQSVTGGGFGGKEEYPSMLAAHAALLARKAGAPVKMIYSRREDIAATTKRHPARVVHRLGLNRDGSLVAVDIDVVLDGGAYVTLSPVVLSRAILHAAGPYRIPHVRITGRVVATNTPPHGAFRGFGAPQTVFATERQIEKAALATGIEPWTFRHSNRLRLGDTTATGQVLDDSTASTEVLDAVAAAVGNVSRQTPQLATAVYPARREGVPEAAGPGTLDSPLKRGRGLAFWYHGAGFTGSGEARLEGRATVATRPDGGFDVRSSSTDIGQGAQTMFTQIAAAALGVDEEHVSVATPDTSRVPDSGPTVASRTCMVVGRVVSQAATALRARLSELAREQAPVGNADLDLCRLARAHHAQHGEAAETATYTPPPGIVWDDETYSGSAYPTFGWACCLVDVAVDKDTGEVLVERCVHAVDVGKAINRRIVEGQIDGGTLQALGWALLEAVPYEDGRVLNPSMTDCIIPTSFDAPEIESLVIEVPYAHGPHGAKGVGEIPMDGPAAAVANALQDALGIPFDSLPMLPEVVLGKLEASR